MSAGPFLLSLLVAAIKAGLLLALAGGIAAALRRAPARMRHSIWTAALAGALLVPVIAPWVPDWSIASLSIPQLSTEMPSPVTRLTRSHQPGRLGGSAEPASRTPMTAAPRPAEIDVAAARPTLGERVGRAARLPAATWLLGLWLLGCLACFVWFLRALNSARRLERGAVAAEGPWLRQLAQAQGLVGLRRKVKLLHSAEVASPMTWGWLRPVILMPARSLAWSDERRRIVLLHELVHVRRADWLVRLLARLACSVYWLNPLVWMAARRLAVEQEIACDEEVVALGTRPSSYARHLLAIARTLGPATSTPAHALDMARRSQMEGRLMSILEGSRRLRGGRKLAILALLLIAGLVPALAAIEPWVEERESPGLTPGQLSGGPIASADTEGLARVLGELEELERRMEPFEAELESLELEMEPIELEMENIEVEMEPIEVDLEGFEAELEPFEEMLEAVEVDMHPHEARLEAIEVELEPFEARLEALEAEMEPFAEHLEAIEAEMAPFEQSLEAIEIEMAPLERELEELSGQMEQLVGDEGQDSAELGRLGAQMRQVQERMAPLHQRMGATHEEMKPLFERMSEAHRGMEPLHERMGAIHQEMEPVHERMSAVHREMEPVFERMAGVHEQMKPVHERMSAVHERMSPLHERMGEQHERMEPYYRKMGEVHERMRPLHEEMGQRHQELEQELTGVVERMLATELADVTAAGTDYAPVASRLVDAVSLRVNDGTLRIMSSAPELRDILGEALGAQSSAGDQEFSAAVERFIRAIGDLEVSTGS
jgi:beta-lactamase regulating signal transducer with metallopeptidase domain/predicted  nucleic acid-binding Zn-ribbon protein